MPGHTWQFLKRSIINGDEQMPATEAQIVKLATAGKIKRNTQVFSPTRTKGKWLEAASVPGLVKAIEKGEAARAASKADAKHQKAIDKKAKSDAAANAEPKTLVKVREQVTDLLTSGESVEFICMQAKPVAIKADAVVVTNKRLMVCHPKMLGRFEFEDMLWRELGDAHIKENIIGSTFTMKHHSGKVVEIGMLSKPDARQLYRIAQEREEEAEETRRKREMEERSAGAMNITMAAPQTSAPPPEPANDPVARLSKLKQMLDAGLIDQADFDKRKAEILSEL